jgi:hypothetical protein
MGAFYAARLERDVATATAVREGSLATLESRRVRGVSDHPFYWGGFVVSGDWRWGGKDPSFSVTCGDPCRQVHCRERNECMQ